MPGAKDVMPASLQRRRAFGANTGLTEPLRGMSMCIGTALAVNGIAPCLISMMRVGYKSKGLFLPQWHPQDQILGPFSLAVCVHELLLEGFSPDGRKQCRKSVMASYRFLQ